MKQLKHKRKQNENFKFLYSPNQEVMVKKKRKKDVKTK